MSVCVSVKVGEGLVLAADSTAAIQGSIEGPEGQRGSGILKTYDHVRKLSHIKDYPIGTLAWGAAEIGSRSIESLIKEYEHSLSSLTEEQEKIGDRQRRGEKVEKETYEYCVSEIASGLLRHIKKLYDETFADRDKEQRPELGILVSGYSSGAFFPEQWLISLPNVEELAAIRPDREGKPDFGCNWYGMTDAIVRLHWGRDDKAIGILAKHFNETPEKIAELLLRLQYHVIFAGMPLQDAINYAVYLVNVVIGRFRFVVGAPLCGGEIDVAVITPDQFTWVQRKSWRAESTYSAAAMFRREGK